MRIFLLILALFAPTTFTIMADSSSNNMKIDLRRTNQNKNGRDRVPARIPEVWVAYDPGTHELEVVCEAQTTGQVYLYDLDGTLEASSSDLNCTLEVPATGTVHVLHIDGGTWTGDAKFTD